jgi:pSer/pThr/pTyr-binding forkhead associated (FHA) protein/predicted MPP superfamily phosphohydrolase
VRDADSTAPSDDCTIGPATLERAGVIEAADEITEQSAIPRAPVQAAPGTAIANANAPCPDLGQPVVEACLLLVRDKRHAGLDVPPFTLQDPIIRIGRLSCVELDRPMMSELVLRYSGTSRQHAIIRWTRNGFVLQDSDSTNGTFVNEFRVGGGAPPTEFPIKRGDHIRFGDLRFIVETPSGTGDRTPLAALSTEVPTIASHHDLWLSTYYRRSIANIESYVFGVVVLRDHKQLFAELSDIGVRSLEMAIAQIVAQRLDSATYAFREVEGNAMRIVIATQTASRIDAITAEIARDLQLRVAEASSKQAAVLWSTSRVDPEVAIRKAVSVAPLGSTPIPVVYPALPELRLVHLSDLHFGAGTESWRCDHEQVIASLVRDLEHDRFSAQRIFVTGDIAFSGAADQYALAHEALQRIASAADLSLAAVRVIPGNHDVDRSVAQVPITAALHHHARASPAVLDALLADPRSRTLLLEKLSRFRAFVGGLDGHPGDIDWRERLIIDGARVDIWGLSSVWISDGFDGLDARGGFAPNLVLAKSQYRELARIASPAELNLVLTHHPLEWISSAHGRWLRSAFAAVPSVHLCGHVHRQAGTAALRLGKSNNSVTLVAGASHAEHDDPVGHSYSRCILRREPAGWALGWSPRTYDPDRDEFRVDRSAYDLDPDGYTWIRFPV